MKNFTVICPGPCNASCSFCTWKEERNPLHIGAYINKLICAIKKLPVSCKAVTVTGGEPTISKYLEPILETIIHAKRFERVVLATNGSNLEANRDLISNCITHLNISRHAEQESENKIIFGSNETLTDKQLSSNIEFFSKNSIPTRIVRVYKDEDNLTDQKIFDFVEYAKTIGAYSICFSRDYRLPISSASEAEKNILKKYKPIADESCPVCYARVYLIRGIIVIFKSAAQEPSESSGDVFEYIFHPNGVLSSDWESKNKVNLQPEHVTSDQRMKEMEGIKSCGSHANPFSIGGCK